jgi:predicted  nucleic acid-binding Zn-ribbon protein
MTLLGKIFTVLIFVMSVLFMGFAVCVFATHKNWKMLVTNETKNETYDVGLVQKLQRQVQLNNALKEELEKLRGQLNQEQAARRHAIGALETKLAEASQRLTEKEAELRTLQSTEGEAAAALKTAQLTVDGLRGEVAQLRVDIRTAQTDRDKQFQRVVELTDQLHAAKGLEINLKERQVALLDEIRKYKEVADKLPDELKEKVRLSAPNLDGIVIAVGKNLIEVSLGYDDGLRVGHRLEVFRDNAYLGNAVVVKIEPNRSVAQVDEKSQKGKIEVRDRVATRIGRTGTG